MVLGKVRQVTLQETTLCRRLIAGVGLALLAACGDSPTAPAGDTGALTVTISGVTAGSAAAVRVTGAFLDSTISRTTTFSVLAPGVYTIAAANTTGPAPLYSAALTQTATVVAGQ